MCIQMNTYSYMYQILKTDEFDKWLRKLRDKRAVAKILLRIQELGNFGDFQKVIKALGGNLSVNMGQ